MMGEIYFLEKEGRRNEGGKGSDVSCFIKDNDYNGVYKRKGKRKKKTKERKKNCS